MAKKAMKKADAKVFKEKLLGLRARLRGDVNTMADAALKDASDARLSMVSKGVYAKSAGQ